MRKKLIVLFLSIIFIIIGVSSFLSLKEIQNLHYKETENYLVLAAKMIIGNMDDQSFKADTDWQNYAQRMAQRTGTRVTLVDGKGNVMGDSDAPSGSMENHYYRAEIQKAYSGKIGVSIRYSKTLKTDMFYVAYPYPREGAVPLVVRVSLPLKNVLVLMQNEGWRITVMAFLGLIGAFFVSYRFLKRILEPIQNLNAATARIAEGQYGYHVLVKSKDEIGELTQNFNAMSERLHENIVESQESEVKLRATLTSMINGIIAVDNERHIMFINPMAELLLGIHEEQVRGRHVMEVVRNNQLDECLTQFLMTDGRESSDIEIFEPKYRILSISANPILSVDGQKMGAVILLQDVTGIRKLEQMRQDFVANVSHELKTPLTSIRGFVETLREGASESPELRERFLSIIDIESSRLATLIDDLLMLSDIESRSSLEISEPVDVGRIASDVVEMMAPVAAKKDLKLELDYPVKVPELLGNPDWFKQMVINLVDNAIKYTPEQGRVLVGIYSEPQNIRLSVKDTGIGIESSHIDRLFERFYRVDKARSREVGGTGLGLAIVKHIVLSMGGAITVHSQLGRGTEFVVNLPLEKNQLTQA